MKRVLSGAITIAAGMMMLVGPAQADGSDESPAPEALTTTAEIVVETYSFDGSTLLSTDVYGEDTEGVLLGAPSSPPPEPVASPPSAQRAAMRGSGGGGSSTASGCLRVTVNNKTETLLGFTAFYFNTWTYWCWNRSTEVISSVDHGWTISDVDSQYVWRGIVPGTNEFLFYDYSTNHGHPKSAYKAYQQGHFENCVVKYGRIGKYYPSNLLRSYYNGTWVWETNG